MHRSDLLPAEVRTGLLTVADSNAAVRYLLARGLITADPVLDATLNITVLPRRNRNSIVRLGDSRGYVLKQSEPALAGGTGATLRREAAFYQALASGPPLALAAFVPGFVAYDADSATIVLDLLSDHDTMAARCRDIAVERFPISAWRAVGAALAAIHHPHVSSALASGIDSLMPSVFTLDRPPLEILRTISPAGLTVLKVVQQSEVICQALEQVRASWSAQAFTHGDIRAENLLYRAPADIHIIDWELSGLGDPAWDLACAVTELVSFWLRGRRRPGETPDTGTWVVFQAAIRALWTAYRAAAPSANLSTQTVARLSAVRMLQSAFEASAGRSQPTPTAVLLLQIAANVLTDPLAAAHSFFALPPAHRPDC